ncbi:MAG: hypothetical protein ACLVJH_04640 [Faecalibacterium prausnitzii]
MLTLHSRRKARRSWMPRAAYALPGLVDIHFHGAMGKDFCDANEEAIRPWPILRPARACWPSAPPP